MRTVQTRHTLKIFLGSIVDNIHAQKTRCGSAFTVRVACFATVIEIAGKSLLAVACQLTYMVLTSRQS